MEPFYTDDGVEVVVGMPIWYVYEKWDEGTPLG